MAARSGPDLGILTSMRLFWELTRLSFRRQVTYRMANFAGLVTNLFFGVLRASVLIALYAGQAEVAGISMAGAVTYTGLTQGIIAYLSLFGWWDLMRTVDSGEIAADLLKPVSFFRYWMAVDLGRALAVLGLRGVTLVALFALIYDLTTPTSPGQYTALALGLLLAWMVSFAWRFLVNLTAFWTPNAVGVGRFLFSLSWFFSGFIMPLRFFPEWFQTLAHLTPFPAMLNTVVEIYLGVLSGPQLWLALLQQLGWFVVLALLAQAVMRLGVRTLVIQGG